MWIENYGQPESPGPDTGFQDWIELSHGRHWMLSQENPLSFEDIPRIWLEQYRDVSASESDDEEDDVTGRVWLYPEDLPPLIAKLTFWLAAYRECAYKDSTRQPKPNWGDLLAGEQDP